jgi:methyltransferase-like protein/2-polyprenyl-3-methyl-5-hydroxy-6-metoxy-1,4-benzoquinol methylase
MPEPTLPSYDEVPYTNEAFPQSHPERLATLARVLGMAPADVRRCRVLELGCARGSNIVPMAYGLPGSTFVGIDLSARQVEEARSIAGALGLSNLDLRHADIADVDAGWGQFDYIVAHGIYSWVPPPIREKMFAICRDNLAPQGVAYISYNTYPGWHMRGAVREMMRWHTRKLAAPGDRLREARAILDFVAENTPPGEPYANALRNESRFLRTQPDAYLYHEHLEDYNGGVYFHEFARDAAAHGLQYLAESNLSEMMVSNFPPKVAQALRGLASDIVALEQYMDFLQNRSFRQTLLARAEVPLRRQLDWRTVVPFHVRSAVEFANPVPSLAQGAPETFRGAHGVSVTTSNAMTKAALVELRSRWPRSMGFDALVRAARARLDATGHFRRDGEPADDAVVGSDVLRAYSGGLVALHVLPVDFPTVPSARPRASAIARFQAAQDGPVVNALHESAPLDRLSRNLLTLLDGTRAVDDLLPELARRVAEGRLDVRRNNVPIRDGPELAPILRKAVDDTLPRLALGGYLEA